MFQLLLGRVTRISNLFNDEYIKEMTPLAVRRQDKSRQVKYRHDGSLITTLPYALPSLKHPHTHHTPTPTHIHKNNPTCMTFMPVRVAQSTNGMMSRNSPIPPLLAVRREKTGTATPAARQSLPNL